MPVTTKTLSGAAGAALADVGTIELEHRAEWLTAKVEVAGAALTDFAFDACMNETDFDADTWTPQLTGTNWADASKFHDGEESGTDNAGGGKYVNTVGDGEHCQLRLLVKGFYGIRFRALGSGATVTIDAVAT